MNELTRRQQVELTFWKNLYAQFPDRLAYLKYRTGDAERHLGRFKGLREALAHGVSLEVGTGLVSMLDCYATHSSSWVTTDPLNPVYVDICSPPRWGVYQDYPIETLKFDDHTFDRVVCVNTLDHVDDPAKGLAEIHRVLIPLGMLYLEVNQEVQLAPAHSVVFSGPWVVEELLGSAGFFVVYEQLCDEDEAYPGYGRMYFMARRSG